MTQVDFYILSDETGTARALLACRLTEKAWKQGHRVYINTASPQQLADLDDLLWTFRAGSFIPHGVILKLARKIRLPWAMPANRTGTMMYWSTSAMRYRPTSVASSGSPNWLDQTNSSAQRRVNVTATIRTAAILSIRTSYESRLPRSGTG